MNPYKETLVETEIVQSDQHNALIVYNDDINTFDHVIQSLIRICRHTPEQAEQCAILVHFTGRCVVKTGDKESLQPPCKALRHTGIDARIK